MLILLLLSLLLNFLKKKFPLFIIMCTFKSNDFVRELIKGERERNVKLKKIITLIILSLMTTMMMLIHQTSKWQNPQNHKKIIAKSWAFKCKFFFIFCDDGILWFSWMHRMDNCMNIGRYTMRAMRSRFKLFCSLFVLFSQSVS